MLVSVDEEGSSCPKIAVQERSSDRGSLETFQIDSLSSTSRIFPEANDGKKIEADT